MPVNSNDTINIVLHQVKDAQQTNYTYLYGAIGIIVVLFILIFKRKIEEVLRKIKPNEYEINISVFKINGKIQYSTIDQEVAWKIYVELITRVSSNRLVNGTGILREALNSLYTAFVELRTLLKDSGAVMAKTRTGSKYSVATLLIKIMNEHMRPFLSKWHPLLEAYEKKRLADKSQYLHESEWSENNKFREELNKLQDGLDEYIKQLKEIAEGKTN